jgi:hypothetical protein
LFSTTLNEYYTPLTHSTLWTISYLSITIYTIFIIATTLYVLSNANLYLSPTASKNATTFSLMTGFDFRSLLTAPLLLLLLLNFSWTGPVTLTWFSHLIFGSLQLKFFYLVTFFFLCSLYLFLSNAYYSSQNIYDYTITLYNFYLWTFLIFSSNNVFTFIFFLEVISVLINLLIVTSTFSSLYFYNNVSLTRANYFQSSLPTSFLQTLLFFFWVSLLSALNLFVVLIFMYLKFLTFDWFLIETIFFYSLTLSNLKGVFYIFLVWLNFLFCVFLKCGLVPFFFWKPTFFKGIPTHSLMFYITFFYFFLFLFLLIFLLTYVSDLFYFYNILNLLLLSIGILLLLVIVLESFFIKTFLAISSIINTLVVFLALTGTNILDITPFL